jgi:hypothetical protein
MSSSRRSSAGSKRKQTLTGDTDVKQAQKIQHDDKQELVRFERWYGYFGKTGTALDMTFKREDAFAVQLARAHTPDCVLGSYDKALVQDKSLWLMNTGLGRVKVDGWAMTVAGSW